MPSMNSTQEPGRHLDVAGHVLKRWWFLLISITVVAFAVRFSLMLWLNTPGIYGGDEEGYVMLAKQFVQTGQYQTPAVYWFPFQGGKPGDPTAFRTPGFPLFLAVHYWIGDSDIFPKITLICLSSLTCMLLAVLGRWAFCNATGILAAVLWAIWPPAIISGYRADSLLSETLGLFLLVGCLVAISTMLDKGGVFRRILPGLLLGSAVLTRPYFLPVFPLLMVWFLFLAGPLKRRLQYIVFLTIGVSIPLIPWIVRNWMVLGSPVLSTQAEHLYMGNNRWARGSMSGDVWTLETKAPQLQVLEANHPDIWQTSEIERSRIWIHEGWKCVVDNVNHTSRLGWLLARKAVLFWGPFQDWSFGYYGYHYAFAVVLVFAVLGIGAGIRRGRKLYIMLLLLPVISVFVVCMILYFHDRIRYTIEPFVIILGAYGLVVCWNLIRRGRDTSRPTGVAGV